MRQLFFFILKDYIKNKNNIFWQFIVPIAWISILGFTLAKDDFYYAFGSVFIYLAISFSLYTIRFNYITFFDKKFSFFLQNLKISRKNSLFIWIYSQILIAILSLLLFLLYASIFNVKILSWEYLIIFSLSFGIFIIFTSFSLFINNINSKKITDRNKEYILYITLLICIFSCGAMVPINLIMDKIGEFPLKIIGIFLPSNAAVNIFFHFIFNGDLDVYMILNIASFVIYLLSSILFIYLSLIRKNVFKINGKIKYENNLILIEDLNILTNKNSILEKLNFSFSDKKITKLSGQNGAGKSVFLEEVLIKSLLKDKKYEIAFVNSNLSLYFLSKNIDTINLFKKILISKNMIDISKWDFLYKEMNIKNLENRTFNKLSSGEKQRLFIFLALVKNFDLIILDEAFSHIDEVWREKITKIINNEKKGIIFVEHTFVMGYDEEIKIK